MTTCAVSRWIAYELTRKVRQATGGTNAAGYTFHTTPSAGPVEIISVDFREIRDGDEDIDGYSRSVLDPVAESLAASLMAKKMIGTVQLPLPPFAKGEAHRVYDPMSGLSVLLRFDESILRAEVGLDA